MAILIKSPLEIFVESYLRLHHRAYAQVRYVRKAIVLLEKALGACCDGREEIFVHTYKDDSLTNAVRQYLSTSARPSKRSLQRVKNALYIYLTCCAPFPPINGVVNDTNNTFGFTFSPKTAVLSDYEFSLDGGLTYTTVTVNPILVGNVNKAIGTVLVRVKATIDFPASLPLANNAPFTITAESPTGGVVNDTTNTFAFTANPDYPALTSYEFTLNGGASYAQVTTNPIAVGNVNKAIGQVGVRVKATTEFPASTTLFNATAFTITAAPPTGGVVDDVANTFAFTVNPDYPALSSYEFTLDSGATFSPVTTNPITGLTGARAIGSVGVRVKAVAGEFPASTTLTNATAYTV